MVWLGKQLLVLAAPRDLNLNGALKFHWPISVFVYLWLGPLYNKDALKASRISAEIFNSGKEP